MSRAQLKTGTSQQANSCNTYAAYHQKSAADCKRVIFSALWCRCYSHDVKARTTLVSCPATLTKLRTKRFSCTLITYVVLSRLFCLRWSVGATLTQQQTELRLSCRNFTSLLSPPQELQSKEFLGFFSSKTHL